MNNIEELARELLAAEYKDDLTRRMIRNPDVTFNYVSFSCAIRAITTALGNSKLAVTAEPQCIDKADLMGLLDANLEAANIALAVHSSIDFIEEHGGANSEDDMERIAYHLFYSLHPADRLRAALEAAGRT